MYVSISQVCVCLSQMCVCLSQMCIDISLLCEGIGLKARMRHALSGRIALLFLFIYKESGCEWCESLQRRGRSTLVFTEHQAYGLAQVDALSRVDEQASIGVSLENLYRIIVTAGHK